LRGIYTLIIRLTAPRRIAVGRHLSISFKRGLYLYTGSALGRSSASLEGRISRHLSREKDDFWHIDRILSSNSGEVVSVIFAETTSKAECKMNRALLTVPDIGVLAKGIGSSDCKCESHFLIARCRLGALRREVGSCYASLRLRPRVLKDLGTRRLRRFATRSDRLRSRTTARLIRTR